MHAHSSPQRPVKIPSGHGIANANSRGNCFQLCTCVGFLQTDAGAVPEYVRGDGRLAWNLMLKATRPHVRLTHL